MLSESDYDRRHSTLRGGNWTYSNQSDWDQVPFSASVGPTVLIADRPKRLGHPSLRPLLGGLRAAHTVGVTQCDGEPNTSCSPTTGRS